MYFSRAHAAKSLRFLFLNPKISLFSLYYCHSYYPAYLVWIFLFPTTRCDKFCTFYPYFFTPIIPSFSLLFPNFYPYFLLKGTWKPVMITHVNWESDADFFCGAAGEDLTWKINEIIKHDVIETYLLEIGTRRPFNPLCSDGFSHKYWYSAQVWNCPFCTFQGHS